MNDPTEPTEPTEVTEPTEPGAAEADGKTPRRRRFRRVRALFAPFAPVGRVLSKIPHPSLKSRRGIFVLACLVAGVGAVAAVGGTMAVHYSETASFCGRCHTMDPELKAYAMSPHKELTCAECHVEPGVAGFVKAKANGAEILSVHISEDSATVRDYATRAKLTFPAVSDPDTAIASAYRVNGIPAHFFIDKAGVLRSVKTGGLSPEQMDAALTDASR